MKIVVFGTGAYYGNRKEQIWKNQVVAFLDNDERKQGTMLDGRKIYAPDFIHRLEYDYIVLMARDGYVREMKLQLKRLKIDEIKMIHFDELIELTAENQMQIYYAKNSKGLWKGDGKRVLMLSHELSETGAPIVLFHAALALKKHGFYPVILSPKDGTLRLEIVSLDIPVVIEPMIHKRNDFIWNWMLDFDFIWVNTLSFSYLIDDLSEAGIDAVWWLHETDISYEIIGMDKMPKRKEIIPVYGVGKCAIGSFRKYLHREKISNLYYGIPQMKQKICFALIGTISRRKGQDIFIEAIKGLDEAVRDRAEFKVIGSVVEQDVYDEMIQNTAGLDCLEIMGAVDHKEMVKVYKSIDVIVCPSRQDPMPVVITEGLMNGKVCIASDATGSADLIADGVNGFVCGVNADSLRQKIVWIVEHEQELESLRKEARKLYENAFAMDVFEKNVMDIVSGKGDGCVVG